MDRYEIMGRWDIYSFLPGPLYKKSEVNVMVKKIIAFILALFLSGSIVPLSSSALGSPEFSILCPEDTRLGSEFTVKINAENVSNMYAYEVILNYDTDILELKGVKSSLDNIAGFSMGLIKDGNKVTFAYTQTGDVPMKTGSMELCSITFKAIKEGEAYIELNHVKIADINAKSNTYTVNKQVFVTSKKVANTPIPVITSPEAVINVKVLQEDDKVPVIEVKPALDNDTAVSKITDEYIKQALDLAKQDETGVKNIIVEVADTEGARTYIQEFPSSLFTSDNKDKVIYIKTPFSELAVPGNMFRANETGPEDNISISIGLADTAGMEESIKSQIGDRPVIELIAKAGDNILNRNNPDAPVAVSIPYTPTEEEMKDPEHIVVWYIDSHGNAIPVSNGRYDPETGKVTFTVTHFSKYAIAYVKKTFSDIDNYAWAKKPIEILASKGIIAGTSATTYSPGQNITRADFITLLVRTLELKADFNENFDDVKASDYYYEAVGTAKALGITSGVGNNKFSPREEILRQDMMVLLARALKITEKISTSGTAEDIAHFNDIDDVSDYAVEGVATLVKEGIIQGSNNNINPKGTATRAETAVVMYRIYNSIHNK